MGMLQISPDGNCLFRAIAHQLYNDQELFREIRHAVTEYMTTERERFAPHFESMEANDKDFEAYLDRMRLAGQWGGAVEILAAEELFDRYASTCECVCACVWWTHRSPGCLDGVVPGRSKSTSLWSTATPSTWRSCISTCPRTSRRQGWMASLPSC